MRIIVITAPEFLSDEAAMLAALLEHGADRIHLRKPGCTAGELAALIERLPSKYYPRISLHDHFGLQARYGIGGIHLNSRNPLAPRGYKGVVSRSCHSLDEVARHKASMDYMFLSPIFDSISKAGYQAAFSPGVLDEAAKQGIIDRKVIALGGVSAKKMPQVRSWGFGGIALLGAVWQSCHTPTDAEVVLSGLSGL
mgnify:CR=1 FL=1